MNEQLKLLVFLLFFGGRLLGQGKMLASCNGGIRFCRQTGANSAGVRAALSYFSARGWCTNPSKTLFFRPLCTKSPGLFSARPAPTWCTDPRKALFFRPLCTRSPDLFGARPEIGAPTRPAADYRPALGGKFPAGALKAEKENGRGPMSLS